jgi:hypothetical protein
MAEPATESEPTRSELAGQVQDAEAAIRTILESAPAERTPGEIQSAARNGWSASVMAIAFWGLVNRRIIMVDEDLRVSKVE